MARLTPDEIKSVEAGIRRGETDSALARQYGVTPKAIRKRREAMGVESSFNTLRDVREEQVIAVKQAHPEWSIRRIAEETNLTPARVHVILQEAGAVDRKPGGQPGNRHASKGTR